MYNGMRFSEINRINLLIVLVCPWMTLLYYILMFRIIQYLCSKSVTIGVALGKFTYSGNECKIKNNICFEMNLKSEMCVKPNTVKDPSIEYSNLPNLIVVAVPIKSKFRLLVAEFYCNRCLYV